MKFACRQFNITTGVIKKKNEVYKVEIHCPNLSPFHSIFMVRRSGIICGPIWGSFPVRGSFAVQFGDHFRSGDHLRACARQNLAISYRNKLLSYNKKLSAPYISRTFNATIQLYRVTSPLKAFCLWRQKEWFLPWYEMRKSNFQHNLVDLRPSEEIFHLNESLFSPDQSNRPFAVKSTTLVVGQTTHKGGTFMGKTSVIKDNYRSFCLAL